MRKINIQNQVKTIFLGTLYYSALPITFFILLRDRMDFYDFDGFVTAVIRPETAILFILFLLFLPNALSYFSCVISWWRYRKRVKGSMRHYVRTKSGEPGAGKSATAGTESVIMAKVNERYVKFRYWQLSLLYKVKKTLSDVEYDEYVELKEAYEFYSAHPDNVWCLFSDIPIRVGRKWAYELTVDHLAQDARLPGYAVCFVDEIGSMLDNDTRTGEILERVAEQSRFTRHYGEFRTVYTEQEETNFFKDLRRIVSYVERLKSQKAVMQPKMPDVTVKIIRFFVWLFGYKSKSRALAKFTLFLKKFESLGFRVIRGAHKGTEFDGQTEKREKTMRIVIPASLNFTYNERTYRKGYRALGSPIVARSWTSLLIGIEHIEKERKFKVQYRQQNEKKDDTETTTKLLAKVTKQLDDQSKQIEKNRKTLFATRK